MKNKFDIGDNVLCKFRGGIFFYKIFGMSSPFSYPSILHESIVYEVGDGSSAEEPYFIDEKKVCELTKENIIKSCEELARKLDEQEIND